MAVSRAVVLVLLIGAACGAQVPLNAAKAASRPSLVSIAKQMFSDRQLPEDRQAVEQDSYLEALEYSQNSASLQGEGGGISGFFRSVSQSSSNQTNHCNSSFFSRTNFVCSFYSSIQNAVQDIGFSRAGVAAAVAVPLVGIGALALLSPLALGRKRRDLDGLEGENKN